MHASSHPWPELLTDAASGTPPLYAPTRTESCQLVPGLARPLSFRATDPWRFSAERSCTRREGEEVGMEVVVEVEAEVEVAVAAVTCTRSFACGESSQIEIDGGRGGGVGGGGSGGASGTGTPWVGCGRSESLISLPFLRQRRTYLGETREEEERGEVRGVGPCACVRRPRCSSHVTHS